MQELALVRPNQLRIQMLLIYMMAQFPPPQIPTFRATDTQPEAPCGGACGYI